MDILQEMYEKAKSEYHLEEKGDSYMDKEKIVEKKTIFVFKGILFNKDNKVLIDNRNEKILEVADGKWEVPGGKIEFGESPEEAVKRELLEETGYNVVVKELIPYTKVSLWEYSDYIQHTVLFFYICELEDDKHVVMKDKRINTFKWVSIDDLGQYDFLPGNIEAIRIAMDIRAQKED